MADELQRNFAADFPAALGWVVDPRRPELVAARAVALVVELCGLRHFPEVATTGELCVRYEIPPSSLRACRREIRKIMPALRRRPLGALKKHNKPEDSVMQESDADSLSLRSNSEEQSDKFFDENEPT